MNKPRQKLVFLVTIWPVDNRGKPAWRASLESVHGGERLAFTSLEELFAYLHAQVHDRQTPPQPEEPVPGQDSS
jgi:hypothetical protein